MATRAHSTPAPAIRRRQPLPTAGRVYAQEGEKPPAQNCAPLPQKDEFRPFAEVRPTVGTSLPPFVSGEMSKIQISDLDLPVRRLRTAFYAAGHLLPIDFADRVALLERRERILDLAEALLDLADAMDAPLEDREPEPVEADDDEASQQPVTLAPDWLRTKNGRRAEARHGGAPQSSRQIGELKVRHGDAPFQAFRAPGELLPIRPAELPVPPPANFPPGFDSDGNPTEPKRRSGKDCHSPSPPACATPASPAPASGCWSAWPGGGCWHDRPGLCRVGAGLCGHRFAASPAHPGRRPAWLRHLGRASRGPHGEGAGVMARRVEAASPQEVQLLRSMRAMTAAEGSALLDAMRALIEGRSIEDTATDFFIRCGRTPAEARIEARGVVTTVQGMQS